jgi:beta-glucosidase
MEERPVYLDAGRMPGERAEDLLRRMTPEERASQLQPESPAIERLGVSRWSWRNECLHGLAGPGAATVFPQPIGLAATWNADLVQRIASAIGDEARARHHEALRLGAPDLDPGLAFRTPDLPLFHDPRWAGGPETCGEDPHLAARLNSVFVRGLQGDDPRFLKAAALNSLTLDFSGVQTPDAALRALLETRFRLGCFDPPDAVPYARIPYEVNDCALHRELAREAARQSAVLLANPGRMLPLSRTLRRIAVIGPLADDAPMLKGTGRGEPSRVVTLLQGIRDAVSPQTEVVHVRGCGPADLRTDGFDEARRAAADADAVILCLGIPPVPRDRAGNEGADRVTLDLPGMQGDLLKAVHAAGVPMALVACAGGPLNLGWAADHGVAILAAWYGGEEGGHGAADVLFGACSPAGRLPVTFYRSVDALPPFGDAAVLGRTYRFSDEKPLFPFGYGLSFSRFEYRNLAVQPAAFAAARGARVCVDVLNAGGRPADEVVQVYVRDLDAGAPVPILHLEGFSRTLLQPGETRHVEFDLAPACFAVTRDDGRRVVEPGQIEISVGGVQPGYERLAAGCTGTLSMTVDVAGEAVLEA